MVNITAKICILTSVHPPYDTRVFYRAGLTLSRSGYNVVMVVPWHHDARVDGIEIRAVPLPRSRLARMTRTAWQVYRRAVRERASAYHLHDPELIPAGLLLKLRGKKVIYDVHEDLPRQVMSKHWIHPWIRRVIAVLAAITERLGAMFFNGIIAATPAIARRFPARKTITVFNFPPVTEHGNAPPYGERDNTVVYAGVIGKTRSALQMVEAISRLSPRYNARLVMAGKISPPELAGELEDISGWKTVDYCGWLSRNEIAALLGRAKVGLVILQPTPAYLESYPVKLFEYMAAGIPVVASDFPLWREIVNGAGCGLLVNPLDPDAIAGAISWVLEHPVEAEKMGQKGREAIHRSYNWQTESNKLIEAYANILSYRTRVTSAI